MSSESRHLQKDREESFLAEERTLWAKGIRAVAGVDEAGRGPLAGPVVAAAVIMPVGLYLPGVDDSKKLSPGRREELYDIILEQASAVGIGIVHHGVIDEINILNATLQAMKEAKRPLVPSTGDQLNGYTKFLVANNVRGYAYPMTTMLSGEAVKQAVKAAKGEKVDKIVYIKITGYGPDQIKQLTKPDLSDWYWIGDDNMPAEFLPQL